MARGSALLAWCLLAAALRLTSGEAAAQEVEETDPDKLVTDARVLCGEAADTYSMGQCLNRQIPKAERLLGAIEASYSQQLQRLLDDVPLDSGYRVDLIAMLNESDVRFAKYRAAARDLSGAVAMGTSAGVQSGYSDFELVIERARFLLRECASKRVLDGTIDLKMVDWCP